MIIVPIWVLMSQAMLMRLFDYPRVFSLPMGQILEKYQAAGNALPYAWFSFALGCLMIVPLALMLHWLFNSEDTPFLAIGTVFGVITACSYVIGIMRWVLLANTLSAQYVDPATSIAEKDLILTVFNAFDLYCGNSFGETIAPVTHALWIILLGAAMLKSNRFGRGWAWFQILSGAIVSLRPLEYAGFKALAEASDAMTGIWAVGVAVMGVLLLCERELPEKATGAA